MLSPHRNLRKRTFPHFLKTFYVGVPMNLNQMSLDLDQLPFTLFGMKSNVRSLQRTFWSVPSIHMYVAWHLFDGSSNDK